MKPNKKSDFSVAKVRRFLEPGPVVLVSSAHQGEWNIETVLDLGDGVFKIAGGN